VYQSVIAAERAGEYLGGTVQVIPHVTDEIARRILALGAGADAPDVVIIEVGGTTGDIEGLPFLETLRRLRHLLGRQRSLFLHVTWVPRVSATGEVKTKPTQHSIVELRSRGITPDVILARCSDSLPERAVEKISLLCDVSADSVIECPDVASVYELPERLAAAGLLTAVASRLELDVSALDLSEWSAAIRSGAGGPTIRVCVVGKYSAATDAYISVLEAVRHAAWKLGLQADTTVLDAGDGFDADSVHGFDCVIIPGGFGERGFEAKVAAVAHCRKFDIPFLGLCLGLQAAVVDAARDAGLEGANSTEFDANTPWPVVTTLAGQDVLVGTGASMRLGNYPAVLAPRSVVSRCYNKSAVLERHRHRYEVNPVLRDAIFAEGMDVSGSSPDGNLVEFVERPNLSFFVATQAHPELLSTPLDPHPLFCALLSAGRGKLPFAAYAADPEQD
jgi:CTP synthase